MAVTVTRTQVRQQMLTRVPLLGRVLTATTIGNNSITHPAEYERQRAGLTSFEAQYIHRYNLADPDRWRLVTTLNQPTTDGIINVDGPVYLDQADKAYERLTVHPDDLNFAIAQGQRRQKVQTNIALVRGHDLDMEMTGTNYWGSTVALGGSSLSNVLLNKSVNDVWSGTQSLVYLATGAPSFSRSELIDVGRGRALYFALIVRVLTGPFTLRLYDQTNGVYFGDSRTLSNSRFGANGEGGWALAYIQTTVPPTCDVMQIELSSTATGATFEVDTCFGPYQSGQTMYSLQGAINEAYKLRFVRPARFISPQTTFGFCDADSVEFDGDLTSPEDFNLEAFRRDANPNRLRFVANSYNNRNVGWGWGSGAGSAQSFMSSNLKPIWLAMEAQVSDFEPLLTETSLTSQSLDECACFALRSLFETLVSREPQNPAWPPLLAEYAAWAAVELVARPPQPLLRPVRMHLQRV